MNNVLKFELENENQVVVARDDRAKSPVKAAKVCALLCVACAAMTILSAFTLGTFYFIFLLLTATLALIAFSEIKAVEGWTHTILVFFSIVLLFISFLYAISGETGLMQFGISYGILVYPISLLLTILSLFTNQNALWKSFAPLAVPALHFAAYIMISAGSSPSRAALILPPLGWALLGAVAYLERK